MYQHIYYQVVLILINIYAINLKSSGGTIYMYNFLYIMHYIIGTITNVISGYDRQANIIYICIFSKKRFNNVLTNFVGPCKSNNIS
jgi:hypothetical protein